MNRLQPWQFGVALALTFSILYVVCALAVAIAPETAIAFFNNWFHGIDLALARPPGGRAMTFGQFASGLVSAALVSFAAGIVLAGCYNAFARGGVSRE